MVDEDDAEYIRLQREAFERQFGSLSALGFDDATLLKESNSDSNSDNSVAQQSSEDESDSELEDSGKLSKGAKIYRFTETESYEEPDKRELRAVRDGRSLSHQKKVQPAREKTESEDIQNDIALQRLLSESHMLSVLQKSSPTHSGVPSSLKALEDDLPTEEQLQGKSRMRTLELRLQSLSKINGHDTRVNKLEKVPMNIRKGMVEKHKIRISKHEKEAQEGGIVLSRIKKGQFRKIDSTYTKDIERRIGTSVKSKDRQKSKKRARGLKISTIGRSTKNGLIISETDIAKINSQGNRRKGKK